MIQQKVHPVGETFDDEIFKKVYTRSRIKLLYYKILQPPGPKLKLHGHTFYSVILFGPFRKGVTPLFYRFTV